MGFADMLVQLVIPYDSEEALKIAEEIMNFIQEKITRGSEKLAKVRVLSQIFNGSVYKKHHS